MERLKELRLSQGTSQQAVADAMGVSRQAYGHYEAGNREPGNEILAKLAGYFKVSTDFLLARPPFDCFELVEKDRAAFFDKVEEEPDFLLEAFGIDRFNPNAATLSDVVNYIGTTYKYIALEEDGWYLARKIPYRYGRGESDDDVKVALFGGAGEVTDAMWEEVKRFSEFVRLREKEKNGES